MKKQLNEHIDRIAKALKSWLQPDNINLKSAIERTTDEKLFSFEDIKYQILTLKETLSAEKLKTWADRSDLRYQSLSGKRVICLHAGNIPLVGIQDLLSVLLTGGTYYGKISKKDPWLMNSLIDVLIEDGLVQQNSRSVNLEDFSMLQAHAALFAGSGTSAINVQQKLSDLRILQESSPSLMRMAHYSVAVITDNEPETMEDLTEAVFRYGGNGCRSVAVVFAPFHLNSEKCSFTDYIEAFWLRNPQLEKPAGSLYHRFAYNKAAEIPQAWLDDFLIEESRGGAVEKHLLYWMKGGPEEFKKVADRFGNGLQSIYTSDDLLHHPAWGDIQTEKLSEAQKPPVWWKPDGTDTIRWLQNQLVSD